MDDSHKLWEKNAMNVFWDRDIGNVCLKEFLMSIVEIEEEFVLSMSSICRDGKHEARRD